MKISLDPNTWAIPSPVWVVGTYDKEGKPNVSRLFRAIAYAEQVHASNHLKALRELKKSDENLC